MPTARVSSYEWAAMALASGLLLGGAALELLPISIIETLGFVTGGVCVWLVVREHIANWPVGLANNVFFAILFFDARLYLDAGLQIVYFGLAVYGWLHWLYGGRQRDALPVTHVAEWEAAVLVLVMPVTCVGLYFLAMDLEGKAPLWDSLTTTMSLGAQWLLSRKRIENWWLWIAADIIYIPFYISQELYLTAALYGVFLTMCVIGIWQWRRRLNVEPAAADAELVLSPVTNHPPRTSSTNPYESPEHGGRELQRPNRRERLGAFDVVLLIMVLALVVYYVVWLIVSSNADWVPRAR